jgi:CRP/FNR family transcriptional regulator, cyclic AMP receptor protein
LKAGRWFRGLSADFQDQLLLGATLMTISAEQRLFSRDDPPSGLYAVLDGALRITAIRERGKEVLLMMAEPPMWFGEIAALDGEPHTHDLVASQDSLLLHVNQDVLEAIFAREPRYSRELARLMAGKLRMTLMGVEQLATLSPSARLARMLCVMSEGYGEWLERSLRQLEVRQEQLASMLYTLRQTVNQMLRDFEGQGILRLAYRPGSTSARTRSR